MDRLSAMETFVRVVEAGSFSAAARQLQVGQPAVSKTIAQLEEWLGVQLLARTTRGLSLTEAGGRFLEPARRTLAEAEEAGSVARDAASGFSGRLRFSAAVAFARLNIVPRIGPFLERHPDLEIDMVLDDRNLDLIEERIDVALRIGRLADSTLQARRIGTTRRRVMATPAYFARAGIPQTPHDLPRHEAIIYARGEGGADWTFRRGDEQEAVTLEGRLSATAADGVREAVHAGLGLAVATDWMFGSSLRDGSIVPVLEDWELPGADLWAVFPPGRRPSAKARAFADFVEILMADDSL